jgi:hypothetical protein
MGRLPDPVDRRLCAAPEQTAAPGDARSGHLPRGTVADRIRHSFLGSAGSIVFGMEDGTVSIFGLVFGVAIAAPGSRAVLLAGATVR